MKIIYCLMVLIVTPPQKNKIKQSLEKENGMILPVVLKTFLCFEQI